MRKTTADRTALGMYDSGHGEEQQDDHDDDAAVVTWAIWLRPPALSTISVLVGLPLTTNVPEMPAARLPRPRPMRSTFSSKLSSYFIA